jgi:MFS family permease
MHGEAGGAVPVGRFAAFAHVSFRYYVVARFMIVFAQQIIGVAVGWQVYEQTGDPFALGMIGLLQFFPALCLFLVTGHVADRYSRRMISAVCSAIGFTSAVALLIVTWQSAFSLSLFYLVMFTLGIERAFQNPAVHSLASNVVPTKTLASALAWIASANRVAQVAGPVAGGVLFAFGAWIPYALAAGLFAGSSILMLFVTVTMRQERALAVTWNSMTAGLRYIMREKVVLGAISLDLFAVLLGGAVALLPIFAHDILVLGPWALGLLRSAPAIGAIGMALFLALYPIERKAGQLMFVSVVIFGLSTLAFSVSTNPIVSILALIVLGASDMVSVVIRQTLVQIWTPDELRGRVNSVNQVFIGASNELGAFRAGTMAAAIGAVPAVIFGAAGTLAVAAIWALRFPQLRRINSLVVPKAA